MLKIDIQKRLNEFELHAQLQLGQEVLAVLGASGAGKSMLLKCLSGLEKPDGGEIIHNDQVFFDAKGRISMPVRQRKIGFLFQNYALFPHMTVSQNISFGMEKLAKKEMDERVYALLKRFRLEGLERHLPSQLSGGQQQRVALARAMAIEPDILLLDEPLSALDEHLRNHMLEDLHSFLSTYHGSVLYVTHHMEEAYRLADRVAIFKNGQIVESGDKAEIFSHPNAFETAKLTGVKNLLPATCLDNQLLHFSEINASFRCKAKIAPHKDDAAFYLGIRPNQIQLASPMTEAENVVAAWIASVEQTPFRNQVVLNLTEGYSENMHLVWEPSSAQLTQALSMPQPISICLPAEHVICIQE